MLNTIDETQESGQETSDWQALARLSLVCTPIMQQSSVGDFIQNPNNPTKKNISQNCLLYILMANYHVDIINPIHANLDRIFTLAKLIGCTSGDDSLNLERLQQLKIMDFGCGGKHRKGEDQEYGYSPWLCRQLHACDVDVTGVDLVYPKYSDFDIERKTGEAEAWKLIIADLSQENALDNVQPNEFDVVNARYIINHGNTGKDNLTSPTMFYRFRAKKGTYDDFERQLFLHALRVLKPGGVFVVNEKYIYKKVGGPVLFHFEEIHGEGLLQVSKYEHVDGSFM